LSKAALVWKSFYHPKDITAAHTSSLFFGAADPGDETYDGLLWEAVKLSADLAAEDDFNTDDRFFKMPAPSTLNTPPPRDGVNPLESCTKADLDRVLEERRFHTTPRDGSLRNPGPNYPRLSTQTVNILDRHRKRSTEKPIFSIPTSSAVPKLWPSLKTMTTKN